MEETLACLAHCAVGVGDCWFEQRHLHLARYACARLSLLLLHSDPLPAFYGFVVDDLTVLATVPLAPFASLVSLQQVLHLVVFSPQLVSVSLLPPLLLALLLLLVDEQCALPSPSVPKGTSSSWDQSRSMVASCCLDVANC